MIWASLGALAIGLSLGMLGSGGAILTVPVLVYLVGQDEKSAIAESLAIVGAIAAVGMLRSALQRRVDFRSAALLAFPGMAGTYLGAHLAARLSGALQLVMLGALMLVAAALMFRNGMRRRSPPEDCSANTQVATRGAFVAIASLQGAGLGLLTGLVGVGGGFLIVPVLVLLRRLPMLTAIGTSLAIITLNSSIGFAKYAATLHLHAAPSGEVPAIHWRIIFMFAAVGIIGSLLGNAMADRIPQAALQRAFAMFLVAMARFILVRQLPRVLF